MNRIFTTSANIALCTALFLSGACGAVQAGNSVGPKSTINKSCIGRLLIQPDASGKMDPLELIDKAMAGKSFDYSPSTSVLGIEAVLVQYYGMAQSLRSLPVDADRKSVARIAYMMQNYNVIAGQMAIGVLQTKNDMPGEVLRPLTKYVMNITTPYHGDDELSTLEKQVNKATAMIQPMSDQPRSFARWAMKAAAFEDGVAHDAAMLGFCSSSPTAKDKNLLVQALAVAKLDRSVKFKNSAIYSGSVAVPQLASPAPSNAR